MHKVQYLFLAILYLFFMQACKNSDSETKIINGRQIDESTHPAVVAIEGLTFCSATFVSHNTLLTAAHCLYDNNGKAASKIVVPKLNNVSSVKIIPNPNYSPSSGYTGDVAIVLFPDHTAPSTLAVSSDVPKVGDTATLVGYGANEQNRYGIKSEGKTVIREISQYKIHSKRTVSLATTGTGDSGGPMIVDGKVVGVTTSGDTTSSSHSRLSAPVNLDFLKSTLTKGATIAGLSPDGATNTASFSQGIFLSLEDSTNPDRATLHVSAEEDARAVAVCLGISAADCQNDLSKANIFNVRRVKNSRSFFKTIESMPLNANQLISAVVLDQNNKPLRGIGVKVTQ